MNQQEYSWTTSDGVKIYGTYWSVENPKAVIALAHGLGEHINRYTHMAQYFGEHNIALIGYDRRGHGQSEGKRGHTSNINAFLDEIEVLLEKTAEYFPDTPVFLYGHSMGGNLVLSYALKRQLKAKGLISSAPHIRLAFEPSPAIVGFGRLIRNVYPGFTQGNGLDVNHLSKDPAVVEAYVADPLVHDRITSATGIGMIEAAKWLDEYQGEIPLPTLIIHGEEDHITSSAASKQFAERVQGAITYKEWQGMYHEIHNEKDQDQVFEYSLNWITEQLGA